MDSQAEKRSKKRKYMAKYRASHNFVQLNCMLPREVKDKLDGYLTETEQTASQFITKAIGGKDE